MCKRGAVLAWCVLLLASCDGDGGGLAKIEEVREWKCVESGANCSCHVEKPGVTSGTSGVPVDRCGSYDCCLQSTISVDGDCGCFESLTTCEAEAASRRDTKVVAQCPPPGEGPPPGECAAIGESCRVEYLGMNDLEGCCEGSVCRRDAAGLRTCTAASAEEIELAGECEKAARQTAVPHTLEVAQPIVMTNLGTFELFEVTLASSQAGPGGCLSELRVSLRNPQQTQCSLDVDVAVVDGRFEVTRAIMFLSGCPGYTGAPFGGIATALTAAEVPFEFEFHGLECERAISGGGAFCSTGRFTLHLKGAIGHVEFAERAVTLVGTTCSPLIQDNECPAP